MSRVTKLLLMFTFLLWVGLAIGAYFRVPAHIQNLMRVQPNERTN